MAKMIPIYSGSTQVEIERRARLLFEAAGQPPNRDLDLWLQAEADFLQTRLHVEYHRPLPDLLGGRTDTSSAKL